MTEDIENSMRKPYIQYDHTSTLATISAEDIEKASKEREKLQKRHDRDVVDLWQNVR